MKLIFRRIFCVFCRMVAGSIRIRQTIGDDPILQQMLKQREIHAKNQIQDYSHVFR